MGTVRVKKIIFLRSVGYWRGVGGGGVERERETDTETDRQTGKQAGRQVGR